MLCSVAYADGTEIVHAEVDINHGEDGWVLVEMDWDPDSGVATYEYVKMDVTGRIFLASAQAIVYQPCASDHEHWKQLWNAPQTVFKL